MRRLVEDRADAEERGECLLYGVDVVEAVTELLTGVLPQAEVSGLAHPLERRLTEQASITP
ncbi:hypothetical protein Ais01nite_02320 [Asanoa ishikariensis]|uniref:hypothetical protein n=1 Tax=Asanoa ishikariensis TaxID=137265 RepID=UPI000B872340|nr:hypothetical protein [Asanoa ishikariensis]GIF62197.1 hypothetical protein Ais01nite_02320 [Asanoa ishikariensis]